MPVWLIDIFTKWDASAYLHLAELGYAVPPDGIGKPLYYLVFFPLYPWLIRVLSGLTGSGILSGVLISVLCLFGSLYFFIQLLTLDYQPRVARLSLSYLIFFPYAFFLILVYSESCFLFFTLATFYFCRRRRWWPALVMGFFAGLTRVFGILIFIPLLWEFDFWSQLRQFFRRQVSWWQLVKRYWGLVLPALSWVIYLGLNYFYTGEALIFLRFQKEHWYHNFVFPWQSLQEQLWNFFTHANFWWRYFVSLPQLVVMISLPCLLLYALKKRLRPAYIWYLLAYWLVLSTQSFTISAGRFAAVCWPVFLLLGLWGRDHRFLAGLTLLISAGLLGLFAWVFVTQAVIT
jgi:hypothetical protein